MWINKVLSSANHEEQLLLQNSSTIIISVQPSASYLIESFRLLFDKYSKLACLQHITIRSPSSLSHLQMLFVLSSCSIACASTSTCKTMQWHSWERAVGDKRRAGRLLVGSCSASGAGLKHLLNYHSSLGLINPKWPCSHIVPVLMTPVQLPALQSFLIFVTFSCIYSIL